MNVGDKVRVIQSCRSLVVLPGDHGVIAELVAGLDHIHGCPAYIVAFSHSAELVFGDEIEVVSAVLA